MVPTHLLQPPRVEDSLVISIISPVDHGFRYVVCGKSDRDEESGRIDAGDAVTLVGTDDPVGGDSGGGGWGSGE